ncbi:uncharacterized protein LOC18053581 isoform X1 [Citrus clementina]|nr:uncharacterized protein LOC18053581 isoform X1 [Citrus x clementina]
MSARTPQNLKSGEGLTASIKHNENASICCEALQIPLISSNLKYKVMAMNQITSLRSFIMVKETVGKVGQRTFAAGASKAKKGGKGAASDAPKASILSKEVKSTTVVGANILKEGSDPKVLPDSEYPDWLWHLLEKRPALSELKMKNIETLPYEDLKRFLKLDNRAKIKENNSVKAKN